MSVRRGKSFCESHVKLKQIKVPSTPMNKVTMRRFFHATDSNHDAVSFDFCNDNTMNSYVCKNINNTSNVNAFMELNDSLLTAQPNGSITILAPKTTPATSKPRVPDILMINKYYGLIPQKFAITSRKPPGSTPSSAHGSRGTTKSSSSKPRAKSSTHHRHPEGRGYEKLKGCRSDNDSPEPIKLGVISRNGSLDHSSSTSEENSSDPFGPVTKKMSVEKYKKWKHSGGGKGRNVNMRSCSVEETLSLMDKGLPDGLDSHANRASARRVIKIDLNKVSWDEENYQITTSIKDNTMSNFALEDEETKHMPDGTHATKPTFTLLGTKDGKVSSFNAENERITIANNDNGYRPLRTKAQVVDTSSVVTCKDFLPEKMNMQSSITSSKKGSGESTDEAFATKMEHLTHTHKTHPIRSKTNFTPDDKSKDVLANEEINGNCEKASEDSKGGTMRLSGKLGGRTISFDDKILDSGGRSASESLSSGRSDSSKKRPMTASVQHLNKTTTFQSPNNFNPPSKVIPWTQQSTTGGKPLTLAERRAKFQRTTSIHSSSSLSLEGGDEETSEVDNSNCIRLPTNSLAYRETRKPLHVIQAPEVTTLISQINPNADEDILIEIEKVAIMLKKMQTKNFSVSLDSGIEAEMVKTSPEPNSISLKNAQNSSLMKLPASVLTTGSPCTLNESESESSITSSDDSNSSDELSQIKNKGSKSTAKVTVRDKASRATSDKLVEKSKELLSISGLKAKQCSATNCVSNSVNSANKRTSSINSTSAATNTTARRPPLRKAVSISCEQELLKTGAQRRNEVNSSANDNGKSPRPKTAAGSHQLQRCYETGTNRSTHNYNHRLTSYVSPFDNRAVTANGSSSSSQGSRNRKILIKKALMEINQSSVNLGRKWGTLGRPRTAPNLEKNTVHHGSVSKQHPSTNSQLRPKPLKASPLPISGNGKIAVGSSGKSSSVGGKSNSEAMEGGKSEQISSPSGQLRANSEVPEENDNTQQQQHQGHGGSSKQSMFRQCFSLDESALLGFSIKSVNEGRIPLFEKWADMASGESCSASIMEDELSFLSAKKREQCLKVYEKMKKTGCEIKLDTIFRGMLTPSEYRAFMRAAENAAQEAEEAEKAKKVSEDQVDEENVGIEQHDAKSADVKEVLNKK